MTCAAKINSESDNDGFVDESWLNEGEIKEGISKEKVLAWFERQFGGHLCLQFGM